MVGYGVVVVGGSAVPDGHRVQDLRASFEARPKDGAGADPRPTRKSTTAHVSDVRARFESTSPTPTSRARVPTPVLPTGRVGAIRDAFESSASPTRERAKTGSSVDMLEEKNGHGKATEEGDVGVRGRTMSIDAARAVYEHGETESPTQGSPEPVPIPELPAGRVGSIRGAFESHEVEKKHHDDEGAREPALDLRTRTLSVDDARAVYEQGEEAATPESPAPVPVADLPSGRVGSLRGTFESSVSSHSPDEDHEMRKGGRELEARARRSSVDAVRAVYERGDTGPATKAVPASASTEQGPAHVLPAELGKVDHIDSGAKGTEKDVEESADKENGDSEYEDAVEDGIQGPVVGQGVFPEKDPPTGASPEQPPVPLLPDGLLRELRESFDASASPSVELAQVDVAKLADDNEGAEKQLCEGLPVEEGYQELEPEKSSKGTRSVVDDTGETVALETFESVNLKDVGEEGAQKGQIEMAPVDTAVIAKGQGVGEQNEDSAHAPSVEGPPELLIREPSPSPPRKKRSWLSRLFSCVGTD
ncbi:unnamed protein product (mitochondrion) [Plasmodiophora brassicae]|uniref:Uncharacterized protein n=1 Tax=Plasmodiophora brassicae TaxID=37360 RepID=A0A3P3YGD2_PLABS|nr:unnamed protein product [Plasmodiophora brassicae]